MSYLVEKVARAICVANGRDPDAPRWDFVTGYTSGTLWKDNIGAAKSAIVAVLDAIAEPSEAMLFRMADATYDGDDDDWRGNMKSKWLAGVAALKTEVE